MTGDKISGLPVASEAIAGNDLVAVTNVSQPGTGETQKFTQDQLTASQLKLNLRTATELTIATGAITKTQSWHTIDTESDAASDNLDTINGGAEGDILFIRPENDARTIVVKHGTGNILCVGGSDLTLDDEEDFVILIYDAGLSSWLALQGGGGSAPVTTAENDFQVGDGAGAWIKKTLAETKTILGTDMPSGFLINGKIVPSVSSNNLTVAIKTLAGADPSAADPVRVRIGDVEHILTAALSVTKNAGTNWFNSGSTELATNEIDYFVYLGYNATDGVVIGFSRIPYAGIYSDFSATTTNEKYCAISTISNAAAGDTYSVIGRFAAILSATAAFNWSVPTFTEYNLINRPIFQTRYLVWTPVVTSSSGTPTTVAKACSYSVINYHINSIVSLSVTDKGTASGTMIATLPFAPLAASASAGRENNATGKAIAIGIPLSPACIQISLYDATTVWVNTYNPQAGLFYRII
jgi:hypothetical protein